MEVSSIDNTNEKIIKDVIFVNKYVYDKDLNVDDRKESDDEYQEDI